MKRFALSLLALAFTASAAIAQDDMKKDKAKDKIKSKDSQEITIIRKGDKDVNVTVEIKGDKILVNGKPLAEFKDDNIIVNNRKVTVWDGDHAYSFSAPRMAFGGKDGFGWSDSSWKKFGKAEKRALLGVTTEKADGGVEITKVTDESGADKAGLKEGDIITKVDDRKMEDENDLSAYISSKKPKDEVTVHYKRDGKALSSKATLGETDMVRSYSFSMPQGMDNFDMHFDDMDVAVPAMPRSGGWNNDVFTEAFGNGMNNPMVFSRGPKIGLKIQDIDDANGVKVLSADEDSPAAKAGLKKDDIITEINGKKVANTDEAREQLKPEEGKNGYSIKAKRDGKEMSFDVKIPKKLKTANL